MTIGVFDFKSIRRSLEHQEQKSEFEEKNPKPVDAAPVVWTPDWGYGVAVPYSESFNKLVREFYGDSTSFNLPDLRGRVKANG